MSNIFNSLKISKKIGVVFFLLLSMMGIGGMMGLYNAVQITNVAEALFGNLFVRQETLSSIEKELLTERQEIVLYLMVHDTASASFLEQPIIERDKRIKDLIAQHLKVERYEDGESAFKAAWSEYRGLRDETIGLYKNGDVEKARAMLSKDVPLRFKSALDILQALLSQENDAALYEYKKAGYFSKIVIWMTCILTIVAIILATGLWAMLSRSIVKPLEVLAESSRKIAGGNLKERVTIPSRDEIGGLADEFNKMAGHLEDHYATLEKKVEERTEAIRIANEDLARKKQEMEILNDELIRANRMKSQFLANMSHELRTPLNSILGFSELLMEKSFGDLTEKQSHYVNYIHTSGGHLLQLINDILDLSKIEAGKLELHMEEFALQDVLGEVLGSIRPLAHKKGVVVESKETPVSPVIKLDRSKFKQIMLNLLSNAVKFNRDGGSVYIDWDISDEPDGTTMERVLRVSVKDTGIGIKTEDIPKIFDEFEQLAPSITNEYGGTGLGLALTKRLIELHNGRIWVESEYGKWTIFSFAISQRFECPEPVITHTGVAEDVKGFKHHAGETALPTIMVASESESLNELIKVYLKENGYSVELASDGVEVIEKARAIRPFAIIVGIALSKKDGWEVLKELKASPDTCDIPAVIVSAANNKELGFALGAVDYIAKPINRERLLATLTRLNLIAKVKRHPFSILCVDDEPEILEFLGAILEKEGLGVIKARSGEEGIALAIERDPDLIVLDLMMPRVSGFDVVYQLKKHPVAKYIPILIFTAMDITPSDKARLGDNIAHILKKTDFSKSNLLNEIKKLEMAYPARARMLDPLTGIFNHRYFDHWIIQEVARSDRYGLSFTMLVIDVDRMHDYNTKHGFLIGNEMLMAMARLIEDNIRNEDCLIRYGGDEFLVVLPNMNKEGAATAAEKLRIRIENHAFPSSDGKSGGRTRVSVGVANFPVDGREIGELLLKVAGAAKSALQSGGNRVVII